MSVTHEENADMPTGLIRRGGRYSIRRRIPLDLVDQYGGRAEIVRALGTSDFQVAKRKLPIWWADLDREFDAFRAKTGSNGAPQPVPEPTPVSLSPTLISIAQMDDLRGQRDRAEAEGSLVEFMQRQRDTLQLTQAMLDGHVPPTAPLRRLEGMRNGLRAFLDGTG